MRLLLDEQMPRKIAQHFPQSVEVDHVQLVGWSGKRNGELLSLAAEAGYDAIISADKNMRYQQNEAELPITVVVLHVLQLNMQSLVPLIDDAMEILESIEDPVFVRVGG